MSNETLTITLTDRPPVRIVKADWPIVAEVRGDDASLELARDPGRYNQALYNGELTTYRLVVRQHADGRALVYGVRTGGYRTSDWRGGELLPATNRVRTVADSIRAVGIEGAMPDYVIRNCIADLPAEQL